MSSAIVHFDMLVRMRGVLVSSIFIAACSGSGVDLEVTYSEHFDSVEVFIGNDDCYTTDPNTQQKTECDGVAWQAGQIRPSGEVFTMNPDEKIITPDMVNGSSATLHLEATEQYRQPRVIAIVAFQGDTAVAFAALWGERIPASSAEHWKVELEKASPASDDVTRPPPEGAPDKRVYAWARERVDDPAAYSRCLALQYWNDEEKIWKSKFVVPNSDPDCDGQAIECDPLYTDYNVNGSANACLTRADNIASMPCAIGASMCADGLNPTGACTLPGDGLTCVPDAACTACEGAGDTVSCLIDAFGTLPPDPAITAFKCTFSPSDGGSPCQIQQASNTTSFTLPAPCKDVEVRDVATPFSNSGSPSTAVIGNPGGASVYVSVATTASSTCDVTLRWNDGLADPLATFGKTFLFVISSNTNNNVIVVPVRLEFTGPSVGCTSSTAPPAPCTHTPNALQDSMYQCIHP